MNIYEAFYNQAKDYLGEKDDKEIVAKLRVASDFVAQMEKMGVQPSQPQKPARQPQNNAQSDSGESVADRIRRNGPVDRRQQQQLQRKAILEAQNNPEVARAMQATKDRLQDGIDITNPKK